MNDLTMFISIHAPREGSDPETGKGKYDCIISIHAPREGSDALDNKTGNIISEFLSTLPARGATGSERGTGRNAPEFYHRSPRGERQYTRGAERHSRPITIHAPR